MHYGVNMATLLGLVIEEIGQVWNWKKIRSLLNALIGAASYRQVFWSSAEIRVSNNSLA